MSVESPPKASQLFSDICRERWILFEEYKSITDENEQCDLGNGATHLTSNEERKHLEQMTVAGQEAAEEIKEILLKAKEFADSRQFYSLNDAVSHAFDKIKTFEKQHQCGCQLPPDVNRVLRDYVDICEATSRLLSDSLDNLHDVIQYNSESTTEDLQRWAQSIEKFGDVLEDSIEFFGISTLEGVIQPLFLEIIEKTQKKSSGLETSDSIKDAYRIRIRNAAGFIVKLIDYTVEEATAETNEISAAILVAFEANMKQ
jgi:uncharacterized protein (DUF885 family)